MLNLSYAWIPLIISFIAGTFALHQIKSNNITNARIKWLENLKQIIAEFLAECNATSIKHGVSKAIALKQLIEQNEKAAAYSEKIYNGLVKFIPFLSFVKTMFSYEKDRYTYQNPL